MQSSTHQIRPAGLGDNGKLGGAGPKRTHVLRIYGEDDQEIEEDP